MHALIQPRIPLDRIVQAWKSVSARAINACRGATGPVWQANYFDRYMRTEEQLETAARYIEMNPVVAGLCATIVDWRWSSAFRS